MLRTGIPARAYFFETPGTTGRAHQTAEFEFVLKSAGPLESAGPEPDAFAEYYGGCDERKIVAFWNLGKVGK